MPDLRFITERIGYTARQALRFVSQPMSVLYISSMLHYGIVRFRQCPVSERRDTLAYQASVRVSDATIMT